MALREMETLQNLISGRKPQRPYCLPKKSRKNPKRCKAKACEKRNCLQIQVLGLTKTKTQQHMVNFDKTTDENGQQLTEPGDKLDQGPMLEEDFPDIKKPLPDCDICNDIGWMNSIERCICVRHWDRM